MRRRGFTLVEVTLVIAITAMLFIAFITNVGSTVNMRRYTEATQDFAEFLRSVYSSVISVESSGTGNSTKAIYGRLVTFGEPGAGNTVYVYDVVGDALGSDQLSASLTVTEALKKVHASVLTSQSNKCYATNQDSYEPIHGAWIEDTTPRDGAGEGTHFKGALLIVRHPSSGNVVTLFRSNYSTDIQSKISAATCSPNSADILQTGPAAPMAGGAVIDSFYPQTVNFCVASDDQPSANIRRNIRLPASASNSSSVQIIPQDLGDSQCNG